MTYVTPMIQVRESEVINLEGGMRGDGRIGEPDMTIGVIRFRRDYPSVSIELAGELFGKCDGALFTAGLRRLLNGPRASSDD